VIIHLAACVIVFAILAVALWAITAAVCERLAGGVTKEVTDTTPATPDPKLHHTIVI